MNDIFCVGKRGQDSKHPLTQQPKLFSEQQQKTHVQQSRYYELRFSTFCDNPHTAATSSFRRLKRYPSHLLKSDVMEDSRHENPIFKLKFRPPCSGRFLVAPEPVPSGRDCRHGGNSGTITPPREIMRETDGALSVFRSPRPIRRLYFGLLPVEMETLDNMFRFPTRSIGSGISPAATYWRCYELIEHYHTLCVSVTSDRHINGR